MAFSSTNTRTTGQSWIPRILSDYVVDFREKNLQAAKYVTRRDVDLAGRGQTVDFPVTSELSSYNYADGDNLLDNLAVNTDTTKSITVNQVPMRPFLILDTLSKQAQQDTTAFRMREATYAVAKSIDSGILAEVVDFSVNPIVNETTPTTALTNISLTRAKYLLDANDVPFDDRAWFFQPQVEKDLMDLTGNYFTSIDFGTDKPFVKGRLSRPLLGSDAVITNNLPSGTAGSPATTYYKNAYFHRSAIGCVMQRDVDVQKEYILEAQGWLHNVRAMYGTTTLRGNHGVMLYR